MRVLTNTRLRVPDPNWHTTGRLRAPARALRHVLVYLGNLGELAADPQRGIQRRHRILVDDGERPAEQPAPLGVAEPAGILAEQREARRREPRTRRQQVGDRHRRQRLARPRLADDADDLARRHLDADVPHGHRAAGKRHRQFVEGEHGSGGAAVTAVAGTSSAGRRRLDRGIGTSIRSERVHP